MNTRRFNIEFDRNLIASLPSSGPRYTSYPTADRFNTSFTAAQLKSTLQQNIGIQPVSLYVHVPFCNTICYYCGCNKIITKDTSRADLYIQYLDKELALLAQNWPGKPLLAQLHFGGGTPTFLNNEQLSHIFASISRYFTLTTDGEYSIEIDPRKVTADTVAHLGKLGFNRMSVGIQDFNPAVQQAVNRIQSEAETRDVIEAARCNGFHSVSVDLIYGLPHQTEASMHCTLRHVLELMPDRIAMYHYAHLPHLFKPQRRIDTNAVPDSRVKLDILQNTVQYLLEQGYIFIGMDHFARPTDELAIALSEGRLQRNFQGYSTHADCDLIAIGVSSISKIANIYSQNEKELTAYYQALDENRLPVMRGYQLNADDILRRQVIQDLMCRFQLSFQDYREAMQKPFQTYFAAEQTDLQQLSQLGLLNLSDDQLQVTPKGRLLIRNIAMIFDYYLRQKRTEAQYSRTL
ncbi:oxygen-independent coproporphyrinogen III oxidase [Snodgrassella sp. B3837]|uniref:oxygen-independent coproporphyrinogen III oxidase n=1 Tax=Snodgrassella sp. B3837 TaxID=2818040 RepID=UPI002269BEA3|nr:oxygen-independent coproporphyrinogen III oxidase [Snodgrassella sp. B3837]MCX8753621.1 oxygen-independent coproporphyrinogen III oxidase [Snodgrassella sp. B3837]